jgi:hypothetical protein
MQTQINAFLETKAGGMVVKIFGYSTKSVPGLEIVGLGKFSTSIKQKFIYLTRERGIKLPLKRFVICLEQNDLVKDLDIDDVKWLEFPLLLIFWYLAEAIPIKTFEDCLCSGYISTSGNIVHHEINPKIQKYLQDFEQKNLKLISVAEKSLDDFFLIETQGLLDHIDELKFA